MKILLAVMSCHAYRDRANAIRATWANDVPEGVDLRFFLGRPPEAARIIPGADEIFLDVPDDYKNFPAKVQAMRRWARDHGYNFVLKLDDDVYLRPERVLATGFEKSDYCGRLRGPSGGYPAPYCSGFAYWLSRRAIEVCCAAQWNGDTAEDRFTGNILLEAGIKPDHDPRLAVVWSKNNQLSFVEPPLEGNQISAACEYPPHLMLTVHKDFVSGVKSRYKPPQIAPGPMNRVAVMVKTFLRDGYLRTCVKGLQEFFPDAKIVVIDDGVESFEKIRLYADLRLAGHSCIWLPFDSGFGAKANAAIEHCDREFVLIASDDFDFKDRVARRSVEKMLEVLDSDPFIDVASGRVNSRPYEGLLTINGEHCREDRGYRETRVTPGGVTYHLCDLTVNFSLIRRRVFDQVRWDGDVKIGGGEHGAFYIDLLRAGFKTCYVEGANINEMGNVPSWKDIRYPDFRSRARTPGRPCLARRGINYYTTFGGFVEHAVPDLVSK